MRNLVTPFCASQRYIIRISPAMEPNDPMRAEPSNQASSQQTITIIKPQDFEELDFSKQLDPENDWESEHPIFMTKIPEETNANLMALQDLKYGDSTPEQVADYCKERGNEFYARYAWNCIPYTNGYVLIAKSRLV